MGYDIADALGLMDDLFDPQPGNDARDETTACSFLEQLVQPLRELSIVENRWRQSGDDIPDFAELYAIGDVIAQAASEHGFVRVVALTTSFPKLATLPAEQRCVHLHNLEYALYEELAAIEENMNAGGALSPVEAMIILRTFCAENVRETLETVRLMFGEIRGGQPAQPYLKSLTMLFRRLHHACRYYVMERAAELSMVVLDLFTREAGDPAASVRGIALDIGELYLREMENLMDLSARGEIPDMMIVEKLLHRAASAAFIDSSTESANYLHGRLGIPMEFRKTLSPENVRDVLDGLLRDEHFFIVRADFSDDSETERFSVWMAEHPSLSVITNVTVFAETGVLFDFLLGSRLTVSAFQHSVEALDQGKGLFQLRQVLTDRELAENMETTDDSPGSVDLEDELAGILEAVQQINNAPWLSHSGLRDAAAALLAVEQKVARALQACKDQQTYVASGRRY